MSSNAAMEYKESRFDPPASLIDLLNCNSQSLRKGLKTHIYKTYYTKHNGRQISRSPHGLRNRHHSHTPSVSPHHHSPKPLICLTDILHRHNPQSSHILPLRLRRNRLKYFRSNLPPTRPLRRKHAHLDDSVLRSFLTRKMAVESYICRRSSANTVRACADVGILSVSCCQS